MCASLKAIFKFKFVTFWQISKVIHNRKKYIKSVGVLIFTTENRIESGISREEVAKCESLPILCIFFF